MKILRLIYKLLCNFFFFCFLFLKKKKERVSRFFNYILRLFPRLFFRKKKATSFLLSIRSFIREVKEQLFIFYFNERNALFLRDEISLFFYFSRFFLFFFKIVLVFYSVYTLNIVIVCFFVVFFFYNMRKNSRKKRLLLIYFHTKYHLAHAFEGRQLRRYSEALKNKQELFLIDEKTAIFVLSLLLRDFFFFFFFAIYNITYYIFYISIFFILFLLMMPVLFFSHFIYNALEFAFEFLKRCVVFFTKWSLRASMLFVLVPAIIYEARNVIKELLFGLDYGPILLIDYYSLFWLFFLIFLLMCWIRAV
jgi:hypothetical protein